MHNMAAGYYDENGDYIHTGQDTPSGRGQPRETSGEGAGNFNQGRYSGVRQAVQRQIDEALDVFANQIPGGGLAAERAKAEVARILDRMERSGEDRLDATGDAQRHETF
ncbi:MAG: hypothetical protein ACXWQR_00870 [Ktedonobacterales bacterium]